MMVSTLAADRTSLPGSTQLAFLLRSMQYWPQTVLNRHRSQVLGLPDRHHAQQLVCVHVYNSGAMILKLTLHYQAQSLLASSLTCRGCMILCDSTGPSSWYAWLRLHPRNSQQEPMHSVDRPGRQTCKPPMLCSISLYVLPCCCACKR